MAKRNLTKLELMQLANETYPDGFLTQYFDESTGEPKEGSGDGLAKFIVAELSETFDPEASKKRQLNEAIRVLETAKREIGSIINRLVMAGC